MTLFNWKVLKLHDLQDMTGNQLNRVSWIIIKFSKEMSNIWYM